MKSSVLISVIIPFHSNVSGLLQKAVLSALNQKIVNVEVIVVDDCSPLDALSELDFIHDERLRVVRQKKNSNGGIARNTGVNLSNGQFIAFLDYDDIWYKDKLEKQLSLYEQHAVEYPNPVIYSKCKIIEVNSNFIRPTREIFTDEKVGDYLFFSKQIIQTSGIFLSKATSNLVQFDNLKRHQDYQYCLALESVGAKFFLLNEVSYEFVQIPKLNDYNFSIHWLGIYKFYLSNSAVKGFNQLVVIRSMISHHDYIKAITFGFENNMLFFVIKSILIKVIKNVIPVRVLGIIRNLGLK
ncbi:glycosyltransferase family 2 protein [Shewanella sp. UCD-KL21]|uniref:glycosyltransferase family 2 protein n=1 Tax=Shewanella sp. UCD-KL21 TaxID=1917164 RepID=UPI0009705709|nr:glycosyltransferase family 2 protein [Shewanella sp. UCD-KL21]